MSSFEDEIAALRSELEEERRIRLQLEEELDLLALDNERLREEVETLRRSSSHANSAAGKPVDSSGSLAIPAQTVDDIDWKDILAEGDKLYPNSISLKIDNACGGMNAVASCFCNIGSDNSLSAVACGGVDKILRVYDRADSSKALISVPLSAPILSLDACGQHLACSLMDGGCVVLDLRDPAMPPEAIVRFNEHNKYNVETRWSPDGQYLATVSHDKSVNLYKRSADGVLEKATTVRFPVTPESALFVRKSDSLCVGTDDPSSTSGSTSASAASTPLIEWELIIALRDSHYLIYMDCEAPYAQRNVSLNEAEWDTHVSFNPLNLSLSPDRKYLLVATDKNMHIVLRVGTNKRLRTLAGGHTCGDYGKPKVSWDCSGKYVICNSEGENRLCVYSVASERCVAHLDGHHGAVRDVCCHPTERTVLSASYDKSVILWGR